jgi:urease subunit gamma/beta
VIPGVEDLVREVQVEGTFPDGTKLVTIHSPITKVRGRPQQPREVVVEHDAAGRR